MRNLSPDPFFRQGPAPLRRKSSESRGILQRLYQPEQPHTVVIHFEIDNNNNNARARKLHQDCGCNCQRWSGYAHDPTHTTVILYTTAEIKSV